MIHIRDRYLYPIILRKLKISPIVFLQGPRQIGKSFLVKELIIKKNSKMKYLSLDLPSLKLQAMNNPESFIDANRANLLAIDEAQKVPDLFDVVKYIVDQDRRPGQFILLGSSEFSKLNLIRESLTGRAIRARLFPFTLAESLKLKLDQNKKLDLLSINPKISRNELLHYLNRGGFPGIFAVRSEVDREELVSSWISLTAERDAVNFPKIKIDSDLIKLIIEYIALHDYPNLASISKFLRKDARIVKKHLDVLKTLFVIHEILPYKTSAGKPIYYLCDPSLVSFYKGSDLIKLRTWAVGQILANVHYLGLMHSHLYYYSTPKGSVIDFILEDQKQVATFQLINFEKLVAQDFYLQEQFAEKIKGEKKIKLNILSPQMQPYKHRSVFVYPWEALG